jgi:hypothetical protein
MRPLILSIAVGLALSGSVAAQQPGGSSSGVSQLPVGQVYKDFQFPYYENGLLKFVLTASDAKGITVNRAETTDLKIELYDGGKVTTTITSPKADLYVADRKMRTHNTVLIERADLTATAQLCDFDLAEKQYTLRNNVRVTLKNFDTGKAVPTPGAASPESTPADQPAPAGQFISTAPPAPATPAATVPGQSPSQKIDSLLESPGMFSSTNAPSPP